ncbi:unnamed protein product [Rangifer tarandus platyrhynchus]|uniref:Secreted protein n=2 Tax=Rangifer tarandus platyrhynchus TaxID=3082113 RepID=A0ABN9A215_RANTA|nr:unnamed protein product [Rangifer tarandus platyrhynchus]
MKLLRVVSFSCYGCVSLECLGLHLASGGGVSPGPSSAHRAPPATAGPPGVFGGSWSDPCDPLRAGLDHRAHEPAAAPPQLCGFEKMMDPRSWSTLDAETAGCRGLPEITSGHHREKHRMNSGFPRRGLGGRRKQP